MASRIQPRNVIALLAPMDDWPNSWAGVDADKYIGRGLVELMKPFVKHLHHRGFTQSTLRRHLGNLWAIGGEVIRDLHDDNDLRRCTAQQLLLRAIEHAEAPLLYGTTEQQQRAADATARKLLAFIATTP